MKNNLLATLPAADEASTDLLYARTRVSHLKAMHASYVMNTYDVLVDLQFMLVGW